jgi:hypothetical protein
VGDFYPPFAGVPFHPFSIGNDWNGWNGFRPHAASLRAFFPLSVDSYPEANKQERSLNAEIVHRLEQFLQAEDMAAQTASVERTLMSYLLKLTMEQLLVGLAALGGPQGRKAAMAAIQTEQGWAAALNALGLHEQEDAPHQRQSESALAEMPMSFVTRDSLPLPDPTPGLHEQEDDQDQRQSEDVLAEMPYLPMPDPTSEER